MKAHDFTSHIRWTGNLGQGTANYKGYDRTWDIAVPGKPVMQCSNDPLLGGDPGLMNPEDLLISALSACHMLWYLHLASTRGIVVLSYEDSPIGHGESAPDGTGRFVAATLKPLIRLPKGTNIDIADAIHGDIHKYCFIARSVNFPIKHEAEYQFDAHSV